jgi:hypothetical protein
MSLQPKTGRIKYVVFIWTAILRPSYPTLSGCLGYRKPEHVPGVEKGSVCFRSDRFTTRMQGRKKGSETIIAKQGIAGHTL